MGRAVWRVTEKSQIGIFGPGPVLAKPPFGIGRPIPTSQNSQLAGYLGGSDSVAMSGGDIDVPCPGHWQALSWAMALVGQALAVAIGQTGRVDIPSSNRVAKTCFMRGARL